MIAGESNHRSPYLSCSVVVTTWQRPSQLKETLHSLLQQSYPQIEIVVVCDGQDPAARVLADEFTGRQHLRWIFHRENLGLPAARNTGAREATSDILLFLDDDVEAEPSLVSTHMDHHLEASAFRRLAVHSLAAEDRQTPLNSFVDTALHQAWQRNLDSIATSLNAAGVESISDSFQQSVCFGLNSSMRRDLFLELGGFNEHFRASDEEMELGSRMHLAGIEFTFEPKILLTHKNSSNLQRYFRKSWRASGSLDVYRVFELGQRCAQTRHLVTRFLGSWTRRMAAGILWHLNPLILRLSTLLCAAANQTKSNTVFSIWARTTQSAEYWRGVRETGCTPGQLRSVARQGRVALMLHSISDPLSSDEASYYISPKRFHRFMRRIRSSGYRSATLKQWLDDEVPDRHVLLTFDDAYDDLYTELFPLVIEHHLTPVVYLVADRIGGSNEWDQAVGLRARKLLTLVQIRELQRYGVEFGSHSLTHPWLPDLPDKELHREVRDSKLRLEDLLGIEIASFAYPSGGVDQRVRSAVAAAGYKTSFTTQPGSNWWNDPLCQCRADVNDGVSAVDFRLMLKSGRGLAQGVSSSLREWEQTLPTRPLRSFAHQVRSIGHWLYRR